MGSLLGFLEDAGEAILDFGGGVLDSIGSSIVSAISTVVGKGLYYIIVEGLLSLVNAFYQLFAVFAGMTKVIYGSDGLPDYLINVFFTRESIIGNIYWGMALIGLVLLFGFVLITVIRKLFDLEGRTQQSYGSILLGAFKSFLVIISMSFIMTSVISLSNTLMQQINRVFDQAYDADQPREIEFTDQQFATMARVINTIGNYSMNPAFTSRYNINSCFNEIRPDMYELQRQGVFSVYYTEKDNDGSRVYNWQNVLQKIASSADLTRELKMDVLYPSVTEALTDVVKILDTNPSIRPLQQYRREYQSTTGGVPIDRVLFLVGTTSAAHDGAENSFVSFTSGVRGAFYSGERSIYDLDAVMDSFDIKLGSMSYVLMAVLGFLTLRSLWNCIVRCTVRIFSMLGLYVVAPPFAATIALDNGEKFKQWVTALVAQAFGIFGTVIPMRLMIVFMPMIISDQLVLFPNSAFLNLLGKALLIVGALQAVESFSSIFTGMLAGNVGMALGHESDMLGMKANMMFDRGVRGATSAAGSALGFAANVTGLGTVGRKIGGAFSDAYKSMKDNYGAIGAIKHAFSGGGGGQGGGGQAQGDKPGAVPNALSGMGGNPDTGGRPDAGKEHDGALPQSSSGLSQKADVGGIPGSPQMNPQGGFPQKSGAPKNYAQAAKTMSPKSQKLFGINPDGSIRGGTMPATLPHSNKGSGGLPKNYAQQAKSMSPQSQKLFGINPDGSVKSSSGQQPAAGNSPNYSPAVQNLFGINADGSVRSSTPAQTQVGSVPPSTPSASYTPSAVNTPSASYTPGTTNSPGYSPQVSATQPEPTAGGVVDGMAYARPVKPGTDPLSRMSGQPPKDGGKKK